MCIRDSPSVSTSYEMTATAPGGCISRDTINITVADVRATIATPDTMICAGQKVQIIASVTSPDTVTLTWLPTAGIANYNVMNPLVAPDTSAMYYLYGYVKGCGSILDSVFIDVQPRPTVYMGGNRFICQFDTLSRHRPRLYQHPHGSIYCQWQH
ncbi:MAG: hypothetical protein EBZ77_16815 [Chitinophagia bacterium]|nr:hypothetical protein [Chitinophagia bacterium]